MTDIVKQLSFDELSGAIGGEGAREGLLAPLQVFQQTLDSLTQEVAEHFGAVQDTAKQQVQGSGRSDLRRLKRQFQTLKSTYVNFDVKDGFIQGLQDDSKLCSDQQLANLEAMEVQLAKASDQLRAAKQQNATASAQVMDNISSVATMFDEYATCLERVMQKVSEITDEVTEHEASRPPPLTPMPEGVCVLRQSSARA